LFLTVIYSCIVYVGLVLYCYLNMPTIDKTYLILSYLVPRHSDMLNMLNG
jgi:hypothetical protein